MRLALDNICAGYGDGADNSLVLRNCSHVFTSEEPTVIVGPNGSGKSTLLRLLAGQMSCRSGALLFQTRIEEEPRPVSEGWLMENSTMLTQQSSHSLFPDLTLFENAGILAAGGVVNPYIESTRFRELEAHLAKRLPFYDDSRGRRAAELSGGQQQQLALQLAAVGERAILLLDEPTASLHKDITSKVAEWIEEWSLTAEKICIIVTHDPFLVDALRFRVLTMNDGKLSD